MHAAGETDPQGKTKKKKMEKKKDHTWLLS